MQLPPISQAGQDFNVIISPKNAIVLTLGEVVQAEVLTVTDTAVAIRMKNTVLEARTNVPLKEGEIVSLLVEGKDNEIRLRLVRGREEDAGSLRNTVLSTLATLKGLRPAAEDVNALNALLKALPQGLKNTIPGMRALENLLPSLEGMSGSVLKNAVEGSGVYFETKLRLFAMVAGGDNGAAGLKPQAFSTGDMKAALLVLQESLGSKNILDRLLQSGVKTETLAAVVDDLLRNVESFQLQSRLNDTLQVFIPFVWQELKDGELIFRESDRDRVGEEAYSCTVNLDLERAGRISARVLLQSGQIYVDISSENDRFSQFLQEGADVLKIQFETAGIRLGNLSIRHQPQMNFKATPAGGLNIRI